MVGHWNNLSPHLGYVWMKAGYSESIEWRRVRLTKQRNVDLTTDGLWAMPLNSGWVPVKSRRLQDWQKRKTCVPNNTHGDVCPNGVPALPEKDRKRRFGMSAYDMFSTTSSWMM